MIQASEFFVRPFKPSDAQSFLTAVLASFNELNYWLPWCHHGYGLSDAQTWIATCEDSWQAETGYPLGIFDAASGQVIGGVGIHQIDKTFHTGEIGYWVSIPNTNRGVAQFAARQTAEMGFQQLGLTRLEIIVLTHNLASSRCPPPKLQTNTQPQSSTRAARRQPQRSAAGVLALGVSRRM